MNHFARLVVYALAAIALFGTWMADRASGKPTDLLQFIPADTACVMAFTEPLPGDLIERQHGFQALL